MAVLNLVLRATDGGASAALGGLDKQLVALDQNVGQKLGNLGGKLQGVGAAMTLGVTTPLVALGVAAVGAASDLGETTSKINVLFGDSAAAMTKWSETSAMAFGQSKQAALDGAATFATFGKSAGLSGKELVGFSTQMVELASDLASFNNTSPEQAIQAIGAALRGETEPMRAYGVLLDDNSMKNEALKLGLISTTKDALTPQQKVLAAQSLILAQTSAAQGDFARTSDGLANQQRILRAKLADTGAELGTKLLPLAIQLIDKVSVLVDWFSGLSDGTQGWIVKLGLMAAAIGPAVTVIGTLFKAFSLVSGILGGGSAIAGVAGAVGGGLTAAVGALGPVIAALTGPIGLTVAAVGLLATAWVRDWGGIRTATTEFAADIWAGLKGFGAQLGDWWKGVAGWFREIDWAELANDLIAGIAKVLFDGPARLFEALRNMFSGAFSRLRDWLGIHSPSTKAATELGLPIAQGIGAGIRQGMPAAMRSVTNNNYFNVSLVGGASAGQDVFNSVQLLSAMYG